MAEDLGAGRPPLVRNASLAAAEVIREAIFGGALKPGERLKEEDIARQLGISRTPVREALLVLQTEGVIEAAPNRGAVVRAYGVEDLEEIYDLRWLLESHAARRAAARATPEDVVRLRESCSRFDRLRVGGDIKAIVRENLHFHNLILEISGNVRLADMARRVIELPLVYKSFFWFSPEQKALSEDSHERITDAIAAGDGDAAEAIMREHVERAQAFLTAKVGESEGRADG